MSVCAACGADNPEPARYCLECGEAVGAPNEPERFRRTVTIVFADLVGSTALGERLDPETLSRVLGEYFDAVGPVCERHGGKVAKYIGDAVMAVFGVPDLHEDDALRAVRAAVEMQSTLARLNEELRRRFGLTLSTRTGVNTGAVAGQGLGTDRNLVLGDAVNTGARLQAAAGADEIVLGELTYRLVRDWVDAELLPPVAAKGKAAPLTAYRLVRVLPEDERAARQLDGPLVGRSRELAELESAFRRCAQERRPRLVTLVGPAGTGKSRLVREFIRRVGAAVRVLNGRCLPYGDAITYWPVAQMVRQAAAIGEADSVAEALRKLRAIAPSEQVFQRVAQAIGLLEAGTPPEETPWAVRRLLEAMASEPLVCVCDDLQWADGAILDLLEHVAARGDNAPILLCCVGRPELLDTRPHWPGVLELQALTAGESDQLLVGLVGDQALTTAARERIAETAEGNPLFLEQLAAMLVNDGLLADQGHDLADAALPLPPTIQALLAARIDRLPRDERHVLTRAAVVGQVFYNGALDALATAQARARLYGVLQQLVRKELIVPTRSDLGSEDAFAFRHLLIRDAAYEALAKQDRAELHERFADWLENAGRIEEIEEILGYHLEQAHRLRCELSPLDEQVRPLADRAAQRLASAARRAAARSDLAAVTRLMPRAVALLGRDDERRPALVVELGEALLDAGRYREADAVLAEALTSGDERIRTRAHLARLELKLDVGPEIDAARAETEARHEAARFAAVGDDLTAAAAWRVVVFSAWKRNEFALAQDAAARLADHYQATSDPRWASARRDALSAAVFGATGTSAALALADRTVEALRDRPLDAARCLGIPVTSLHAMRGDFALARELGLRARATCEELGAPVSVIVIDSQSLGWYVARLARDWEGAERELRRGYDSLATLGEVSYRCTVAGFLAHCLCALGRDEEAGEFATTCAAEAAADDVVSQVLWRSARARLLARGGRTDESIALAQEAAVCAGVGDCLDLHADTLLDLADLLRTVGRRSPALDVLQQALRLYEQKEHLVGIARAQALAAEIDAAAAV